MEQMVKRAHYYANRGEFGKAWAAFSPSAPADGRDPKVVANYLGKTPQARAPPASVTADEPGAARYDLKRLKGTWEKLQHSTSQVHTITFPW